MKIFDSLSAYVATQGAIQVKDIYQTFDYSHAKHWFVDCKSKYFDVQTVTVYGPGEKRYEIRLSATGRTINVDDTFTVPTVIVLDLERNGIDWHIMVEPDKDELHIVAFRTDFYEEG